MAPPSRPSLTLKAAKKLESCSEALLSVDDTTEPTLAASKVNSVYVELSDIIETLSAVKELCDIGKNTYPNYPAIRLVMIEAGEKIYKAKQEVEVIKNRFLETPITDIFELRQRALELGDVASRLRAVVFVPARKKREREVSNNE